MTLWSADAAAAATGGRLTGAAWSADGVSIDTRTLRPGDLFVALKDVRDGHEFIADALAKGAAAALVSRVPDGVGEGAPLLVVADVLEALAALGRAGRARTRARVVAVTGSAGKTSTKEMLSHALSRQGRVHAAEASYNNHWGVPLTLARMPEEADFAVIEIGMNAPGEIAPLARMAAPHVAVVTTVAPAHLAAFASVDDIAREKASIFEGLEPGGTAIFNADLATSGILTGAALAARAVAVPFGRMAPEGGVRADEILPGPDVAVVRGASAGQNFVLRVGAPGTHVAMNALAVLAAVRALGGDWDVAALDLASWQAPSGRGARRRVILDEPEGKGFDLIDDAFNANPASMEAAFQVLATSRPGTGGRRIAILGDMLELGASENALHAALAERPEIELFDAVHSVGPRMRSLHEALPEARRGLWVESAEDMKGDLRHLVRAGDVVLVKGSKGSRVSLLAEALARLGEARRRVAREEAD